MHCLTPELQRDTAGELRMRVYPAFVRRIESLRFNFILTRVHEPNHHSCYSHSCHSGVIWVPKQRVGGDPEAFAEMQAAYQILCSVTWQFRRPLPHY